MISHQLDQKPYIATNRTSQSYFKSRYNPVVIPAATAQQRAAAASANAILSKLAAGIRKNELVFS